MDDKKFILIGLDDDRAGDIAEVMKNKTCKKILDFLAEKKEASEQDISKELNMPINTTEYNLKKLIKSGLVEKSKNFFWSVKGKKIDMYKLAKKHIIISPNKRPDINALKSILPIILGVIAIIAIIIATVPKPYTPPVNITEEAQLKQFKSYSELKAFIKKYTDVQKSGFFDFGLGERVFSAEVGEAAVSGDEGAEEYSTTNIQVEGVDEADIVKNDGKYIYVVSGDKVLIVDAYPAENLNILSEIDVNESIGKIFINEDKLVIFSSDYGTYGQKSMIYIYDISDREEPELEQEIESDGYYVDSRMIGDFVYVISTKYISTSPEPPIYRINGIEEKVLAEEVYYFDYPDSNYVFTSIMNINLENGVFNSKVYLAGSSRTIYVSMDNIYLTYQKKIDYEEYAQDIAEMVYFPLLPNEYDKKIQKILDSDIAGYRKLSEMSELTRNYYTDLEIEEMNDFVEILENKTQEFQLYIQKKTEKTIVHKININRDEIEYKGVGEAPGRVLNQFSMDEYNGYFRIATTSGDFWRGTSLNNLYILDEELKIIGKVENLAKGERIYSARFMGKRAYIVTFKNIDPLFVIDLEEPEEPEVLGYLKVTGYSDYLHPYDENHLIGIGKETTEADEESRGGNFAWYQGVKISLFDVSDVENPEEISKIEIGDRGTDSAALHEHKAVLFDKKRNLLVIPINLAEINMTKLKEQYGENIPDWAYGEHVWQGAYVFKINLEGIETKDKITHDENQSGKGRYYYAGPYSITRSLYMDDILYTISQSRIKANSLEDLKEINSVDLGYKETYPEPILYEEDIKV